MRECTDMNGWAKRQKQELTQINTDTQRAKTQGESKYNKINTD